MMNYIRTIEPFPYEDSIYEASSNAEHALEQTELDAFGGLARFTEAEKIVNHRYVNFIKELDQHIDKEMSRLSHTGDLIDRLIIDEANVHRRRAREELTARRDRALEIIADRFVETTIADAFADVGLATPPPGLKTDLMSSSARQTAHNCDVAQIANDITNVAKLAAKILSRYGNLPPR